MKTIVCLITLIFLLFLINCDPPTKVKPLPIASFSADPTTINAGETVHFYDESENSPTVWVWDFGDGSDYGEVQNPSHTYTTAGTYSITLGVSNDNGDVDTETKTNYITVKVVGKPPVAAFSADDMDIEKGATVQFTDQSTETPTSWLWNFGDGNTSTLQNPSHQYNTVGIYSVSLTASNAFGQDIETKSNFITVVAPGNSVTFNNPVFTDISVTCNGSTQTILPGSSVTFYNLPSTTVSYTASTSGKTTGGAQVGLALSWSNTLDLTVNTNYNLNVSSTYFFIYIRNNGTHTLINLYVNYGLVSQTYDNIVIPHDNVKYRTGYYKAYTNSNVRMYWQDNTSILVYWVYAYEFTLPWTNNQSVELTYSYKKSAEEKQPINLGVNPGFLFPEATNMQKLAYDKNAIDLYCK